MNSKQTSGTTSYTRDYRNDEKASNESTIPAKEKRRKSRGDCTISTSTSHTQYWRRGEVGSRSELRRITTDEYCGLTAVTSSSESFLPCRKDPEGAAKLKKKYEKYLDDVPKDPALTEKCRMLSLGWDVAEKIKFLITDPVAEKQIDRIQEYLRDFAKTASNGFRVDILDHLCVIFDYLVESLNEKPYYRERLKELLEITRKPVLLIAATDATTFQDTIKNYIAYLGYLLLPLEDDDLFELVSRGLLYQLSAPERCRGQGALPLRDALYAARHVLTDTVVKMIAIAKMSRFRTFISLALILAKDSLENCMEFMMENIFENIFYRFNPYFPDRELPIYDINPYLDDSNIKLGHKDRRESLDASYIRPYPLYINEEDLEDIMCFVWVYRYECRDTQRRHNSRVLTVIVQMLIYMFRERLTIFSNVLMPDVLALSVKTEVPPKNNWTRTVHFNVSQKDVQFKKYLIQLSIDFLKLYPMNRFMAESQNWTVGLMYLVDPGLYSLKTKWTASLYAELQKLALQALLCSIELIYPDIPSQVSLIRRILWYIEWYTECPYELPLLYWSVRLLSKSVQVRSSTGRHPAIEDLITTHGVIIIINLCNTLVNQKLPPMERCQSILALNLRLLTSCLEVDARVSCYVYPTIKWPASIDTMVRRMMDVLLYCMEKRTRFIDRWLLAMMNLVWEAIIWKKRNRDMFIANNGIYKLLDIVAMSQYPVQCLILALICDVMREGGAVAQLVTWRANRHASNAHSVIVRPGATIASLLAALFKKDCIHHKVKLDESNVIQDLEFPLMSEEYKKYMYSDDFREPKNQNTPFCLTASEVSGSRMAKCFAILQMLSEDLKQKVDLADDAYNLYKNIQLQKHEETILVLMSHYLTIKLNETWLETQIQCPELEPTDTAIVDEFLHIGKGWAKSIQEQQMKVVQKFKEGEKNEECNLYSFLERVRLNTALDSLREVKCIARSTDRARITHALIFDAVRAYHRRSVFANKLSTPVVQTYKSTLDDYNLINQNMKLINILPKNAPKVRDILSLPPTPPTNSQPEVRGEEAPAPEVLYGSRCSLNSGVNECAPEFQELTEHRLSQSK